VSEPELPQINSDLETTPLRDLSVEAHEMYEELLGSGFPVPIATAIVAKYVSDAVMYNKTGGIMVYDYDDDDEDDEDDDLAGDTT